MTILEIILLAAGALLIAASFFFPEKEEASIDNIDTLVRDEVKASIEAESENMRRHVEDVVDEAVSYAEEKTEMKADDGGGHSNSYSGDGGQNRKKKQEENSDKVVIKGSASSFDVKI